MEGIVKNVQVFDERCIGCEKFEKQIMVSFMVDGSDEINDLFFSTEQAEYLRDALIKRLNENKNRIKE